MINLYIDFDGVIMDTIERSYKVMEGMGIPLNKIDRREEFYRTLDWEKLLSESKEINNSYENIHKIVESGIYNVNILTHVNSLKEAENKIGFIRKRLHEITIITVPQKINKTKVVSAKGAILIDDYTENLIKWEEAGGIGVKFSIKLHGNGFTVIDHLDQIIELKEISQKVNL